MPASLLWLLVTTLIPDDFGPPGTLADPSSHQGPEVSLQVYYETNCPDSVKWVTKQLAPTYERLGKYIRVDFNPFGKADWQSKGDGGYTFTCQHGWRECYGNLFQACLLDKVKDNSLQVKLVNCIMSADVRHYATQQCMDVLDVEGKTGLSYDEISRCQSGREGESILQRMGVRTKSVLRKDFYYVPWITINQDFNKENFGEMQYNLFEFMCQNYLTDKPECQ